MSQQTLSRFFTLRKKTETQEEKRVPPNKKETPNSASIKKLHSFACKPTGNVQDDDSPKVKNEASTVKITKKRKSTATEDDPIINKRAKLTDFEQQILDFKLKHMDKLLFIQSGYRYKFFGEDAKIASKILNIKLTDGKFSFDLNNPARNDHLYSTFAQASVPIERLLVHVRRLVVRGYKVGVVNQIETAAIRAETKSKSKVFDRFLSYVYSAGTFISDEDLEKNVTGKSIVCINESTDRKIALVSVNVYFTDVIWDEFTDDFTRYNLESRLHHLEPIEIITLGEVSKETLISIANFRKYNDSNTSNISHMKANNPNRTFSELLDYARREIGDNDEVYSFFMNLDKALLECFAKLIEYLKEFKLTSVFEFLDNFKKFSSVDKNTILDASVLKHLEIFNNTTTGTERGSLFQILDNTYTKFGQRMLRYWLQRPLIDKSAIIERHDALESLINKVNGLQMERLKNVLKACPDLELILSRIHYERSNRKEVYLFLKKINEILSVFRNMNDALISLDVLDSTLLVANFNALKRLSQKELSAMEDLMAMINSPSAIDIKSPEHTTNYFNSSFFNYVEIEKQNAEIERINSLLEEELENIRKLTKNRDLQFMKVNNEPFLIQIRKANVKHVPSDWIRISATLNCVRYRSPETVNLYKKLRYHEDVLKLKCDKLFLEFTSRINTYHPHITKLIRKLGEFDALLSLTSAALNNKYSKPKIVDIPTLQIKNARNPVTEQLLKERPAYASLGENASQSDYMRASSYIENDFNLQKDEDDFSRIALITGPNMGGKSSFMRQIGLIVIMSQIGSFIPCDENTTLGIFANICIRLGSNDDIFAGKSTFQVELMECHQILQTCVEKNADPNFPRTGKDGNSLILMDELGRGTSTVDGCSIAWSVLDYLVNQMLNDVLVLFVTHFRELEAFEHLSSGVVKNYHMGYKILKSGAKDDIMNTDVFFTYKLIPGPSSSSYGVYCAKVAGLPQDLIMTADRVSRDVETKSLQRDFEKIIDIVNDRKIEKLYNIADIL